MKFYQYTKVQNFQYEIIETHPFYKRGLLSFRSPFNSDCPSNDTVYVDIFEPIDKTKWPPVILLHSWMETKNSATEYLAKELSKKGFGAYLLHLPYHLKRTPPKHQSGSLFITSDYIRSINAYRQAIIDVMALCDWLETREEIVKDRIGIVGVSLGALILNTVMGIDSRIKAGVSILGGGNLHYISIHGLATIHLVIYEIIKGLRIRHYREMTKDYIEYLKKVRKAKTPEEIENIPSPREWFLIDPLTYAHLNHPRNVLMINGRFDLIIPYRATVQLWEALGKPEIIWLPSTHLTSWLFRNTILRHTFNYLNSSLLHQ